jgi:hypothetical protein
MSLIHPEKPANMPTANCTVLEGQIEDWMEDGWMKDWMEDWMEGRIMFLACCKKTRNVKKS